MLRPCCGEDLARGGDGGVEVAAGPVVVRGRERGVPVEALPWLNLTLPSSEAK